MSGAQEQKFLLERDLVEVLELLVSMMGNVTVTQRNLVDAVSELQHAMLEHEHPQPEMEASSAADAQNTRKGLRGQAQQSQLHSRRLIQQAKELCARAERLDVEAAQLTGGTARPTPSMPPPSTPGRRDEARRARETDRR